MGLWTLLLFVCVCQRGVFGNDYCERNEDGSCKVKEGECGNDDEPCFLEEEPHEKYDKTIII